MTELTQKFTWQGRTDSEDGERGLRWHQVVNQTTEAELCTLVGFACDLGVKANKGRVGASDGPNVIRTALANMAWHADAALQDRGDIVAQDELGSSQQHYATAISKALATSKLVIGLGGGHEIAWGSYQGLQQHLASSNKKIGIINFDAHFDLRKPAPLTSSGTPFWQIAQDCQQQGKAFHYACLGVSEAANTKALFDAANATNTLYLRDFECDETSAKKLLSPMLVGIDELYVTICLDAFPASVAPGVSAPSALGISVPFVINMLHWLASSQLPFNYQWQLADVAEMNPTYDIDNRTAKLAARLIFEMTQAQFRKA